MYWCDLPNILGVTDWLEDSIAVGDGLRNVCQVCIVVGNDHVVMSCHCLCLVAQQSKVKSSVVSYCILSLCSYSTAVTVLPLRIP